MHDLRERPLTAATLPIPRPDGSARLTGDDSGYRQVAITPLDRTNPDPVVRMNAVMPCYPIYALGALPGVCNEYGRGLGASPIMHLRRPAALAIQEARKLLWPYDRDIVGLDFFRHIETQRLLWVYLLKLVSGREDVENFDPQELIRYGRKADDVGSYANVKRNQRFTDIVENWLDQHRDLCEQIAAEPDDPSGGDPRKVAELYIEFKANLGFPGLEIDESLPLSHPSGGAADVGMIQLSTGRPIFMGTGFDTPSPFSAMRAFEDRNLDEYRSEIEQNSAISLLLKQHGIDTVSQDVFDNVRLERRLFTNAFAEVGATYYEGEWWHFALPNRGGNQYELLPDSGNTSQAICVGVRDPDTDEVMGNWDAGVTHELVRADLAT